MLCLSVVMCLKINLHSGIHLYTVVFGLHGTVFRSLIVAERLVQQVIGFGIECSLYFLSERIACIGVHVVHFVVVTVVESAFTHFIDKVGSEIYSLRGCSVRLSRNRAKHWRCVPVNPAY